MKSHNNDTKLKALGYCVTSRKFGLVSRIDRDDWKEYMALLYSPWSLKVGMDWVSVLGDGAEDHYRRCYSTDTIEVGQSRAKSFPKSHTTTTGYILK